jgi:hypothetical protein
MGAGGSEQSSFMHILHHPPTVWALKPPSWALVHKTTNAPMIYTALCIMAQPNPLPLALVMDMHASKTLCTGLYK